MSFSAHVKDDLCRVLTSRACCRFAEFAAFFLISGSIRMAGQNRLSLIMPTEHPGAARKMFSLAREFLPEREVAIYRRTRLKKNQVYNLLIPDQPQLRGFLSSLGLLDEAGRIALGFPSCLEDRYLRESCCRRAYLRGAFLAAGSISAPESGYHLEINGLDKAQAGLLQRLLEGFDLSAKTVGRKGMVILYLKEAEQISDFMNIVGSHRSLLEFESVRVTKEMRNNVNRRRNCDTANVNKTVTASMRQVADIQYVFAQIGAETLPQQLRQTAELRLEYPEESLADLALLSGLGRSALNHRLRRLCRIADNIRDYGSQDWNRQE